MLLTVGLVAMTAAVYGYPRWGGYYLFAGVWMLTFLSLTPLILKAMMFDRRAGVGLGLIALKILLLGAMIGVLSFWSRREASRLVLGTALAAGLVTPLLVVVLRVLGGALGPQSEKPKSMTEEKP